MTPVTAIDIETIRNDDLVSSLPEPEPPANLKDPEKIAADIAKKREEQISKMALSPMTGRICAWSRYSGMASGHYMVMPEISDKAEIELITELLRVFCTTRDSSPHIVTWNGHSFDIPFIFKRAMILHIPLPPGCFRMSTLTKRYARVPSCDLMQEFAAWAYGGSNKLDHVAAHVLGRRKIDVDVLKFPDMIRAGEGKKIGEYCLNDSRLTWELYQVMSEYLF